VLKGTVPRDFLPLFFFFKLFLLGPGDMPSNDFDFFRLFAEIFDYFGASPVSTPPVSDTFTVLESFTGVNDTGKKLLTGVSPEIVSAVLVFPSQKTVRIF
jgi:hypothetical protein